MVDFSIFTQSAFDHKVRCEVSRTLKSDPKVRWNPKYGVTEQSVEVLRITLSLRNMYIRCQMINIYGITTFFNNPGMVREV
jgi:hypothetical protein